MPTHSTIAHTPIVATVSLCHVTRLHLPPRNPPCNLQVPKLIVMIVPVFDVTTVYRQLGGSAHCNSLNPQATAGVCKCATRYAEARGIVSALGKRFNNFAREEAARLRGLRRVVLLDPPLIEICLAEPRAVHVRHGSEQRCDELP